MQLPLLPNPFLVAGFMFFGLLANVAIWKTVAEVNAQLPDEQKFSHWWWTFGKHMRLWKEHKRLCRESHWRFYSVLFFVLGIAFMFLTVLSAAASVRVKITLPKQNYGVQEVIPATVENRGTSAVTFCVEFGQWSPKKAGLESTPLPFWVEQNSDGGWHTLLIGPDVGSSRHAVELDSGKSLDFPFMLDTTGTLRLQLQYWPGSRPQLDCSNPPKGARRVRSISFSVNQS